MIWKFLTRKFGIPLWVLILWGIFTLGILALAAGTTKVEAQTLHRSVEVTRQLDPWTGLNPTLTADWGGGVLSNPGHNNLGRSDWGACAPYSLDIGGGTVYTYPPATEVWPGTRTRYEVDVWQER